MEEDPKTHSLDSSSPRCLSLFHQLLLSTTVAFSAAFVLFLNLYRAVTSGFAPPGSSNYYWYWYLFLRAAVRLNSIFGREAQSLFGITTAFLTLVLVFGLVLFLGLSAVVRTRAVRLVLDPIAGTFLFALFPVGVLLLPNLGSYAPGGPSGLLIAWSSLIVAIVAGIIYLSKKWAFPVWVVFPVAAYYAFFAWVYFGRYSWTIWRNVERFDFLNVLFFLIAALAGMSWTLFAHSIRQNRLETLKYAWKWLMLPSIPLLVLCLIPWLPARSHSVAHPNEMTSVNISLKRSYCYGMCPVYQITIHGDGSARYEGKMFIRTKGPEITKIPGEVLNNLLQSFDREDFSTIDDRAFGVCFDAPHTIITISIDDYTKTVNIDDCFGNSRPKAGVIELGKQIDDAVGSKQWVECQGGNCVRE